MIQFQLLLIKTPRCSGFVGAISVVSGAGPQLDSRFLGQLCLMHVPIPGETQLHHVFSQLLGAHLRNFTADMHELADTLTRASLHLYTVNCDFHI